MSVSAKTSCLQNKDPSISAMATRVDTLGDGPPMDGKLMEPELIQGFQPLALAKHVIHAFTEPIDPPPPPPPGKSQLLRLVTISNSHFCEKARWALDLVQADQSSPFYYLEEAHPSAFQCIFTLPVTNNTQSRTPLLVWEEETTTSAKSSSSSPPRILRSSNEIVRTMCPHLYPPAMASAIVHLEQDLGYRLGATVRSIFYCYTMMPPLGGRQYYPAVRKVCTAGDMVTPIERFLFNVMLDKGVDQGICDCLQLTPERNVVAEQVLRETFDELSRHVTKHNLVHDQQAYWMDGDGANQSYGFTAADLTIATFVAVMIGDVPALDGRATNLLTDEALPPAFATLRAELRATPLAAYARRIYQQHRPVSAETGRVVYRPARRGKLNPLSTTWSLVVMAAVAAVGVAAWRRR